jgi:predicted methyltransferase
MSNPQRGDLTGKEALRLQQENAEQLADPLETATPALAASIMDVEERLAGLAKKLADDRGGPPA